MRDRLIVWSSLYPITTQYDYDQRPYKPNPTRTLPEAICAAWTLTLNMFRAERGRCGARPAIGYVSGKRSESQS